MRTLILATALLSLSACRSLVMSAYGVPIAGDEEYMTPTPGSSCCVVCGHNLTPCGDSCIMYNALCHAAAGCAC